MTDGRGISASQSVWSGNGATGRLAAILALALTYALLGIMMNSVGVVILQSINHLGATKVAAASLEACKDLSVVAATFVLANQVARFGYRLTLIVVLVAVALAASMASVLNAFWAMQLLFVVTGLSFGAAKVATYSTIGLLARTPAEHASITGMVEGLFMVGVLAGVWLFSWLIEANTDGSYWLRVYWILAGLACVCAAIWLVVRIDESEALTTEEKATAGWRQMMSLAALPATVAALAALLFYVMVEQGVGTWLPTLNSEVLHLPAAMSVQMASIYLAALAAGRLASSFVLRRVKWVHALMGCLAGIAALILVSLPLAHGVMPRPNADWMNAPLAAYIFPLLGFFLAPIYPTVCSAALSALPRHQHPTMVGLIVIFSAAGGTIGSSVIGALFQNFPGAFAFYFLLAPVAAIALMLLRLQSSQARSVRA